MIGKGTFGVVYLVKLYKIQAYLKNKKEVALKRVPINPKYKNREI